MVMALVLAVIAGVCFGVGCTLLFLAWYLRGMFR